MTEMLASFSSECRKWRRLRNLSQLDLALAADISQKHLSYLENGKSRPSREMVLRLSEALDIPLRDRNSLLHLAGFSAFYQERELNAEDMLPISSAIDNMLNHHAPYPAIALNKQWDVIKQNAAFEKLMLQLSLLLPRFESTSQNTPLNAVHMTIAPHGLKPIIVNWTEIASMIRRRLENELITCTNDKQHLYLTGLLNDLTKEGISSVSQSASLLPVIPLILKVGEVELSLFSVISTFGTPQDVTTDEIRIECFYPMDDVTADFFRNND